MQQKKEVTIYDIAKKVSVSSATVSRALNNNELVSLKTRIKIQAIATKLGYRHNNFASSLRKQNTNTIGVIIHEFNSYFITSVLAGIEKVTAENGYDLLIAHSSESFDKEAANSLNLFHKRVDGVLVSLSLNTADLKHFEHFEKKGVPVIFFDRVDETKDNPKVIIDNYKGGYEATQHLIEQGCKRIVIVTASQKRNVYAERYKGYKKALRDYGIKLDSNLVFIKDLGEQSSVAAANHIIKMEPMPDGAFITNDFSAAVFMQTLKEHGVKIPQDIAVVGFNNDAICKLIEPQLSTIRYPGKEMGELAANAIIDHLKGISNIKNTNTIVVHSELIVRNSSLKKR